MRDAQKHGLNSWLTVGGVLLLAYAVLGNYVALPGYIRFLERGGTSAAGNHVRPFGAASAQPGRSSGCTPSSSACWRSRLAHSIRDGLHTKHLAVGAVVWLALWSWPALPAPGPWFYLLFGGMTLGGIALMLLQPHQPLDGKLNGTLFLGAIVFFAFATWEVCGLGSTGRILHPEQSARPLAHNIVVTQSSKLMFEFLFAWGLLLASTAIGRSRTADS